MLEEARPSVSTSILPSLAGICSYDSTSEGEEITFEVPGSLQADLTQSQFPLVLTMEMSRIDGDKLDKPCQIVCY